MVDPHFVKSEEGFLAEFPPEERDAARQMLAESLAIHRKFQQTGETEGVDLDELEHRLKRGRT